MRRCRFGRRATIALVFCVGLASSQQTRSVHGTVRDRQGHLLAGSVVQIQNDSTMQMRSYITHEDGTYRFEGLPTDVRFRLQAVYHHHFGAARHLGQFSSHKQDVIDLTVDLSQHR